MACLFSVGDKGFAYTITPAQVSGALQSFSSCTVSLDATDATGQHFAYETTVADDGTSALYTKAQSDFPNAGPAKLQIIVRSTDGTIIARSDVWEITVGEAI